MSYYNSRQQAPGPVFTYHERRANEASNSLQSIDRMGEALVNAVLTGAKRASEVAEQARRLDESRAKVEFKQYKAEEINRRSAWMVCFIFIIPIIYYCEAYSMEYPGYARWRREHKVSRDYWFAIIMEAAEEERRNTTAISTPRTRTTITRVPPPQNTLSVPRSMSMSREGGDDYVSEDFHSSSSPPVEQYSPSEVNGEHKGKVDSPIVSSCRGGFQEDDEGVDQPRSISSEVSSTRQADKVTKTKEFNADGTVTITEEVIDTDGVTKVQKTIYPSAEFAAAYDFAA